MLRRTWDYRTTDYRIGHCEVGAHVGKGGVTSPAVKSGDKSPHSIRCMARGLI